MGREAVPAGGLATCSRAVLASCPPALRPACEVRRGTWGLSRRSYPPRWQNLHRSLARIAPRDHTPLGQEPWWNAEGCPLPFRGRRRTVKGAEVRSRRLPAFHILYVFGETEKAKRNDEANHPSAFFLLPVRAFRLRANALRRT